MCKHNTPPFILACLSVLLFEEQIEKYGKREEKVMIYQQTTFGTILKNARVSKKLTQAELAEKLDISVSYLKDLERFRNNPSYELFEKVIRFFNLSADAVIYANQNESNSAYEQINRLLNYCDKDQLHIILSNIQELLYMD